MVVSVIDKVICDACKDVRMLGESEETGYIVVDGWELVK